jgi:hypothetical protein
MQRTSTGATILIALIFVVAALSGCMTPVVYHAYDDITNSGYTDEKDSEAKYVISYVGGNISYRDRINDFGLLRAAEVTLNNRFAYFQVFDRGEGMRLSGQELAPDPATEPGQTPTPLFWGNPNQTASAAAWHAYMTTFIIRCASAPQSLKGKAKIYDARLIAGQLRKKYSIVQP